MKQSHGPSAVGGKLSDKFRDGPIFSITKKNAEYKMGRCVKKRDRDRKDRFVKTRGNDRKDRRKEKIIGMY